MTRILTTLLFCLLATVAVAQTLRIDVPLGDSPSRGVADAAVVMVEFIDFQ